MKTITVDDYVGTNIADVLKTNGGLVVSEIRKALDDNLSKGLIDAELHERAIDQLNGIFEKASKGEGSKGGKVIGHTGSGKPIYDKADHSSHEKFSFKDHIDASNIHHKRAEKHFNTKTHEKFSTEKDEQFAHEKEAKKKFKKDNLDYHMGKFDKEYLGYHTTSKSDAR